MDQQTAVRLLEHIKSALVIADENGLTQLAISLNRALVLVDGVGTPPPNDTENPKPADGRNVPAKIA